MSNEIIISTFCERCRNVVCICDKVDKYFVKPEKTIPVSKVQELIEECDNEYNRYISDTRAKGSSIPYNEGKSVGIQYAILRLKNLINE